MKRQRRWRPSCLRRRGAAWSKLHDNLTSQITARSNSTGRQQTLANERDPQSGDGSGSRPSSSRMAGRTGRLGGATRSPLAAALNGVKGHVLDDSAPEAKLGGSPRRVALLERHRPRDPRRDDRGGAGAFPDFRRYLRLKARLLGIRRTRLVRPVRAGWRRAASLVLVRERRRSSRSSSERTATGYEGLARRAFCRATGLMPARDRAKSAVAIACGCSATNRASSSTTRRRMTASRRSRTSSVTPTTT